MVMNKANYRRVGVPRKFSELSVSLDDQDVHGMVLILYRDTIQSRPRWAASLFKTVLNVKGGESRRAGKC
jgi:hypothetical protein